jgi:hypothetical protein
MQSQPFQKIVSRNNYQVGEKEKEQYNKYKKESRE